MDLVNLIDNQVNLECTRKTCRLCANSYNNESLLPIFSAGAHRDLVKKIQDCVSITVLKDDELPKHICTNCNKQILQWEEFVQVCKASEDILKSAKENEMILDVKSRRESITVEEVAVYVKEEETAVDVESQCGAITAEEIFKSAKEDEVFVDVNTICESITVKEEHSLDNYDCDDPLKDVCDFELERSDFEEPSSQHKCSHCAYSSGWKNRLDQHIICVHPEIKNYICHTCSRQFATSAVLKIHMRIHSDRNNDKISGKKRKSYSIEYKKAIVEESRNKNLSAFCEEKKLDLRMVRKWRTDFEHFSELVDEGNGKKRKCGSGRRPLFLELEDITMEWIADRRTRALVVRRADIQEFALTMAPHFNIPPETFKASRHWLDNFFQRYELSLKSSKTLLRLQDAELIKRALAFKYFVDGIDFSNYHLSNMIAMDENAVFIGEGSKTTVEQKDASMGYESARVTCILAIRLDGTKVPPLIITKGKKEKIERVSGINVLETEKAWCTQAVLRKWVDLNLPIISRGSQRGLLVWDSASTHRSEDMKTFLARRKIDQIMIPAGMTFYLNTLDLAINELFKDYLRMEMNEYIEDRMERNQHEKFVKPNLQEVVNWVKNSWDKITDSCVANALRTGYLDKNCSFNESFIAKHDRLGPKILSKIGLQEVQSQSQSEVRDFTFYDDIPEEDEMIVLE